MRVAVVREVLLENLRSYFASRCRFAFVTSNRLLVELAGTLLWYFFGIRTSNPIGDAYFRFKVAIAALLLVSTLAEEAQTVVC